MISKLESLNCFKKSNSFNNKLRNSLKLKLIQKNNCKNSHNGHKSSLTKIIEKYLTKKQNKKMLNFALFNLQIKAYKFTSDNFKISNNLFNPKSKTNKVSLNC